jgi:tetratricopeptide (TPR) repeat protein
LIPEVVVTILGYDHLAAGEKKLAVEIMKLVVNAYPHSADAYDSLSDAYLADGQKDLARQTAEKALALLDSYSAPASSWSDTEARRKFIRDSAAEPQAARGGAPDRDVRKPISLNVSNRLRRVTRMRQTQMFLLLAAFISTVAVFGQQVG